MKVSLDRQNGVNNIRKNVSFKGFDTQKSKLGDLEYTFNLPYDDKTYDAYLELCEVQEDENGNFNIVRGLPNKNIDVSGVSENDRDSVSQALPLKSGKTTINLNRDYGISQKSAFGYHFKLVPKGGGAPFYRVDNGDVMDFSEGTGFAHNIYNIVKTGSQGFDVGSQILLIPDSYNAMFAYDKDGKVVPNLKYPEVAKATKHFSNKLGGSLAGVEHDLDAGKFDNYTKIISTPLFTDDSLTPHSYWNKNCMQMAHSLGNIKNYQNLQKKLFEKGINWVSDGAFVNEGLEGVHFRHVLKWGKNSPYFNWFRASGLNNKPLTLGVFPKDTDIIGAKIVNAPFNVEEKENGKIHLSTNKNYNKKQPTYLQVFDKRLVTDKQAAYNTPLIKAYTKLDTGNTAEIVTHDDTVIPYSFEVDPDDLKVNFERLDEYNANIKKRGKEPLDLNSYQAIRMISKFPYFTLDEKIEGGFDTWDANVDIAKINYTYSRENVKDLHNIMNSDKRIEYNELLQKNNFMTQDYAITSAKYWTNLTNRILNLHVAQNLKNVDSRSADKVMEQINQDIINKTLPAKTADVVDKEVVENVLFGDYNLKPLSKEEYRKVIINGMMDTPLDTIELGDNIVSVFASPYMAKRATHEDELGVSRSELDREENPHLDDEFRSTYLATNKVYEHEMYYFAQDVLEDLNKKLPKNLQINSGLNVSEYGKYVLPYLTSEIAKFAVIKGLFPDAEVKVDEENGGIIYDYDKLKSTSLQSLGIVANSPKEEAELLISKLKGSKLLNKGIPGISDKDKAVLVDGLYKMIEGTNATSFKLAEMIVDRTRSGLDWRIDATKDIADVESLRKHETDFEDTWGNIIDFWGKFAKAVYKENPNSYLVAEVTNEREMHGEGGSLSPKYQMDKDIVMKFLRETGITSIANYSHFFTDVPALFGKNIEKGEDWGVDYSKIFNVMGSGCTSDGNRRADFLHSGPLPSLISSYTFADNHDKPRILHGLAMDMGLFYADLTASTSQHDVNSERFKYKETAYKVLHGRFMPNDSVQPYEVNNYDFTTISPKAIAMGDAMGNAFGKALQNMSEGEFRVLDRTQQNKAYRALASSIAEIAGGSYLGENFQSEAFGVRPFDLAIDMVVNQAVKEHGLKLSDDPTYNKELLNKLKKEMFYAALAPAVTKAIGIMKTLVALPGNPTLFAGDDMVSTGYEQLTKNIYLQNRSAVHHEWLEEDSPEKQFDFFKEKKAEFDEIMATRKRPELKPLNDGAPYLLPINQAKNSPVKVPAVLRQSTDGSMTISLFSMAGANHDYRQKNDPATYPVSLDAIELDAGDGGSGIKGGLREGMIFVDSKNPDEHYVVKHDKGTKHYYIVNEDSTKKIFMDDNTKILFYISPESQQQIDKMYAVKKAIENNSTINQANGTEEGDYKRILDLRRQKIAESKEKQPSFSGRLYNPQYNFVSKTLYAQPKVVENGSKLSLIAK